MPARSLSLPVIGIVALAAVALVPRAALGQCVPEWLPGAGVPGVDGEVKAMASWDRDGDGPAPAVLAVAGDFRVAGTILAGPIAMWDGVRWSAVGNADWAGVGFPEPSIKSLIDFDGDLVVAGEFSRAGGVSVRNVARWNGSAWQPMGADFDGYVEALAVFNGSLIAAGSFRNVDGAIVNGIARWDGERWRAIGGGTMGTGHPAIVRLAVWNGRLVASGGFSSLMVFPRRTSLRGTALPGVRLGPGCTKAHQAWSFSVAD